MSLILNIDTALNAASVCLAKDEEILSLAFNDHQTDHAAWLHQAIVELLQKNGFTPNQLDAIAVSIGPGSYTGLRVGLSAAKGLCYALNIPLIAIGTLKLMANAVKADADTLICPMIDARRMEVFTAVYNKQLGEIIPAHALLLDETCFASLLATEKILFCGSGSKKLQPLVTHLNATFSSETSNASNLSALSIVSFRNNEIADLAYIEPLYIKEFYSPAHKV
jgi:tRNA threonylcarbamoyladenosine biosynthesis protein TsaB